MPIIQPSAPTTAGTLHAMQEPERVTVIEHGQKRAFIVRDRRADGRLVLDPEPTFAELCEQQGLRPLTDRELAEFEAEHGQYMLPADGEG